jgi:hypothetical protein
VLSVASYMTRANVPRRSWGAMCYKHASWARCFRRFSRLVGPMPARGGRLVALTGHVTSGGAAPVAGPTLCS